MKTVINPSSLAAPRGSAHGILTRGGTLLFLAGQMGTDTTGKIGNPFDLIDQFQTALENLKTVVTEAGGEMTDIVKLTIFITDKRAYHAQRNRLADVYHRYFGDYFPAITLLEIKALYDPNAMIEIDGIAVIPE
jgi:enamine deaminase RidA (YjgF/YER057c/UK114 family)